MGDTNTGTFVHNAGSVSVANNLTLGNTSTGNGTYNMNGGTLAVGLELRVGQEGVGAFNQTGGAVTVAGWNGGGMGVYLGNPAAASAASSGSVTISGGTFTASGRSCGRNAGQRLTDRQRRRPIAQRPERRSCH